MLKLSYAPILVSLLLGGVVACDGGGGSSDTDADINVNPDPDPDPQVTCNPVTQAGCEAGEKCAQLVASDDPFLASTDCVPDGQVQAGGACTRGEAGANGYDDCIAGYDCLNGVCTEICDQGPPDTCRAEGQPFGEGNYCTLFADLFSDSVGLCIPGCDPTDDTACGDGFGCYLNSTAGVAACAGVPAPAAELGQNEDCYGPASGGCFLNGCASGFTPLLNNKPENADGSVCARYCTPEVTYKDASGAVVGAATGTNGNCDDGTLAQNGGLNNGSNHQCRFIQTFYSNTDQVPAEVGMCVAVNPPGGGTWGNCTTFEWDGIVEAWNGAVDGGTDPNEAFNSFCLTDPNDPMNSDVLDKCIGLFRGCLSLEEEDTKLLDPAGGNFRSRKLWAESLGISFPALNTDALQSFE